MNYYYPGQQQYSEQQQPQPALQPQTPAASFYSPGPYVEDTQERMGHTAYDSLHSDDYELRVRQQPRDALVSPEGKDKTRKPIDPPPIVEVMMRESADPIRQFLNSPYLFMTCGLVPADTQFADTDAIDDKGLAGMKTASLNKLKDMENNTEGGFFVFGDMSARPLGEHRLVFSLYDLGKDMSVTYLKSVLSEPFTVHPQKEHPPPEESTQLSRSFADQGVRLRLRKEVRTHGSQSRKRANQFTPTTSAPSNVPRQAPPSRGSATEYTGGGYSELSRSPSKRQKADDSASSYRESPHTGYGSIPDTFSSPGYGSRVQSVPGHVPGDNRNRWSYFGQPGSATSQTSSDFTYRSTPLPRLDPNMSSQHSTPMLGSGGFQPTQPPTSMPSGGPYAAGSPSLPSVAGYTQQPYGYGALHGSASYPSYASAQSYRPDTGYASHSNLYTGSTPASAIPPSSYDPSQGYSASEDSGAESRPPTTRTWA